MVWETKIPYSGSSGINILPLEELRVSKNASKASISVLSRSNFLSIGDISGIKVSLAVPKYFFCIGGGYRIVEAETPEKAFLSMGYSNYTKRTIGKERIFFNGDFHKSQMVRSGVFVCGKTEGHIKYYSFYELPINDSTEGYLKSLINRSKF